MGLSKKEIKVFFIASIFFSVLFGFGRAEAAIFFQDSFETGNLSFTQAGTVWTDSAYTQVVSEQGRTGSYALRFRFGPNADLVDSWSEQRFQFGAQQPDVYIRYYIKFPSNYVHRTQSIEGDNNKMIRLWKDVHGDVGQIGASAWPGNLSEIGAEAQQWGCGAMGQGNLGTMAILSPADLNKWLAFEWHFRVDSGSGNGIIELWIDGVQKFSYTNLDICDAAYFRNGYLLGWSNSGFAQQTDIYVDDVVFSTTYIGLSDLPSDTTPPSLSAPSSIGTTKNKTPNFSFTSSEAGTITYAGSCSSSATTATAGVNTVTLSTLAVGTKSTCTITVTDSASNASTPLSIPTFHITYPGDLDLNRNVNIFDYNILLTNFGQTNCGNSADIDGNCSVNIFDYNTMIGDFGKSF